MKLFLCVCFSAALFAQPSPGSLFSQTGSLSDPARDFRAHQVGDIVTIVISDTASAVATGATNTSRKSSAKNGITSLVGVIAPAKPLANLLTLSNDQEIQGTGTTSRNTTLSTTVSARVTSVTLNGLMAVEALKDISVNSERQIVKLTGLVRPEDLTTANTISSNQVADLSILINGKGVVGDAVKRPNFLYRFLLGLLPF